MSRPTSMTSDTRSSLRSWSASASLYRIPAQSLPTTMRSVSAMAALLVVDDRRLSWPTAEHRWGAVVHLGRYVTEIWFACRVPLSERSDGRAELLQRPAQFGML